MRRPTGQLGSK